MHILASVLVVTTAVFAWLYLRERSRRKGQGLLSQWPIPPISLDELDPVFSAGPFGPTRATEVAFIGRGPLVVPGGTSDGEAWILAVLAKQAARCFEFGTCTGKTAYLWARNAPPEARVVTLTLAPEQAAEYARGAGDSDTDTKFALAESAFTEFVYTGTPEATRITQLFGDSKAFDETAYTQWADLVFVDGSHAESYVESDSAKAMRIVKPGGLVLWHDYAGPRHAPGVFAALNRLAQRVPLRRVEGTTFVAWRAPSP
ncbi:class I SAM-dependent methyltransferase [Gemmatimonas sp.]